MLIKRFFILSGLLMLLTGPLFAQHQTSSPYSSYGLGKLRNAGFAANMALGYTGVATRPITNINPVNPASYTAYPEKNFTLEAGLKYNISRFKHTSQSEMNYDINIDYLSFGFPVTPWWAFAFGLTPYSSVGYDIKAEDPNYITQYKGQGGINEVFFGTAFELFNHISIGINGSYLFGKTEETIVTDFKPEYSNSLLMREDVAYIDGLSFNVGAQGTFSINNFKVNIGVKYNKERALNTLRDLSTVQILNINDKNFTDTISEEGNFSGTITVPEEYGIGVAAEMKHIKVTAEYTMQDWTEADYYGKTGTNFAKQETYKAGVEMSPDMYSTRYLNIVHYRIGGYYKNSYLQLPVEDGTYKQIKSYGITAGLLLPIPNTGTRFNLGFDYGTFGTTSNNLLAENYLTINFGFVFKDIWFRKRKFN